MAIRHASAGEIIDLKPLGAALKGAKTTALVKNEVFETARLIVHVGKDIKTHSVDGPITLHCIEGRVVLTVPGSDLEMSTGDWLFLDGKVPHSLRAIEDASLLLTIIFPPATAKQEKVSRGVTDSQSSSRLEQGLIETFPASDPVAISNPIVGIRIDHHRESKEGK